MATKDKGLEKSLSKTLVDDIINQGTATINAVVGQQQTTIAAVTAHTDLEIARVGSATQAKKVELETKKDEMLIDINTQGGNAVTQGIATINSHTDDKKIDLDNHEQAKEVQMNELYSNLEAELQRLITEALQDRGVVINGADWHNLTSGNYYVSDLMGSGYINQPQLDPDENSGIVLVSTSGRGKYKVMRYYSVAKKMHFLINANNTWSEWSTVSEGGGLKYEYTQPNHGFTFNAVQLDGNTNTWVLADKNTGADGIAVRIDSNRFELAISGSYHIPSATRDSQNRVIEADEFYFLSNSQVGGFDKEKPIELFQPLFRTYLDEDNRMLAEIDIDTPVNLVPRILVDEIESLDIATVGSTIRKENTIAELQRSNRYKIGNVVEVLGYYSAGDGAGHKRKIEQANDESGVQLANGLWANIVHSGEVNISWFGARGDGITDDTLVIQKAANFNNKAITVFGNKIYLISDTITFDNSNFEFKGIKGDNAKINYQFQNKPAIVISGGSGKPLMKDITGIEFEGTETTTGIEIRGACGVFPRKCEFKTNRYGVKFSNDVRVGTFSEGNIAYNCRFYSSCKTAIFYFKGAGDRSFHGSGLWDCWVDTQASNSMIEISSEALPYNAPLNFRCLSATHSLINNQGSSDVNFYGNINIEGEIPVLASGNRVLFAGTINGHGKFLNGSLVEVEKMHTSGGAGGNVTKIKRKKSITKITLQSGIRKELFIRKGRVILNIGDYSHEFCVCRASNGGNTKIYTPISTNSRANFEQLGVSFGDSKIIFTPSISGNLYVTLEYNYDIAGKDEVIGYEI